MNRFLILPLKQATGHSICSHPHWNESQSFTVWGLIESTKHTFSAFSGLLELCLFYHFFFLLFWCKKNTADVNSFIEHTAGFNLWFQPYNILGVKLTTTYSKQLTRYLLVGASRNCQGIAGACAHFLIFINSKMMHGEVYNYPDCLSYCMRLSTNSAVNENKDSSSLKISLFLGESTKWAMTVIRQALQRKSIKVGRVEKYF